MAGPSFSSLAFYKRTFFVAKSLRRSRSISTFADTIDLPASIRFNPIESNSESIKTKFASVALVGASNAGKSTILNRMVGGRIAAVSRKVNTTRRRIIGVCTEENCQLAFCDTPGIVERQFLKHLGSARQELAGAAWGAAADSDLAVFVVDAARGKPHWRTCIDLANQLVNARKTIPSFKQRSTLLVINKIDKVRPRAAVLDLGRYLMEHISEFTDRFHDARPFYVSAVNGRGIEELKTALQELADPGNYIAPDDDPTAFEDDRDLCVEHIWEKLLHCLHQELPYQCRIENEVWKKLPSGEIIDHEKITVPRRSQIPIFVGQNGDTIKWISAKASQSASELLGCKVSIRLRVVATV